ncbi:hypothetical protein [Scytonema sp. NUACC26]|uniref:hypothetical protein n=1 Tax=Scytonema sp. NUACC26 TaxID=3140176 RepID=UPI0034DBAA4A
MEYLAYSLLDSAYAEATEDAEYDLPEFQFQFRWNRQFKSTWLTIASLGTIGTLFAIIGQVQPASAAYYGSGYQYYANTNGGNLNVRSGPGYDYPVISSVRNGAALASPIRSRYGFVQLSTGNWVSSRWISTTPGYGYRSGYGVGGRYGRNCYCYGSGGRYYRRAHYGYGGRHYSRRAHYGYGGRYGYDRVVYRPVYRNVYVYRRPYRDSYYYRGGRNYNNGYYYRGGRSHYNGYSRYNSGY